MQQRYPEPFDVNTIEDAPSLESEIHTLIGERGRNVPASPLRRAFAVSDRAVDEPAAQDAASMEEPPRRTDASEALLSERKRTHGNFEDNARVSQSIKRIMREQPGWLSLTDVEREVMDMIALKFSRMLSGRSLEKQHWEDVVGYAKLALNQAEGKPCNA